MSSVPVATVSPQLREWLEAHRAEIKPLVHDPNPLDMERVWAEIIAAMRKLGAPGELITEAERLEGEFTPEAKLSHEDRVILEKLHKETEGMTEPAELEAAIERSMGNGLSAAVGDRLIAYVDPNVGKAIHPDGMVHLCALCGAFGALLGGGAGAAVGCIACVVAAQ